MILFIAVCSAAILGGGPLQEGGSVLLRLDREMSGLLDGYLEAVPECPVRGDTPLRIWLIDLAWIRANSARLTFGHPPLTAADSCLGEVLGEYLGACDAYLEVYGRVRRLYHGAGLPDSAASVALEDELITADSAWLESGARLFGMLREEE